MSNYYIIPAKISARTFFVIISCLFFFTNSILAQNNTSYNANTISIGGQYNTAFGWQAFNNSTGFYNAATGYQALFGNTTGSSNTANGAFALYLNSTGYNNTANGYAALDNNTTGSNNTASGYVALLNNTTGDRNAAHGAFALNNNTTGYNNDAHGAYALYFNTTGSNNAATGYQALYSNTIGSNNTANGTNALVNNTTGSYNTANGVGALFYNYSGSNNTALGDSAGFWSNSGSSNVFIGNKAGFSETGSNKMYIGNDAARTLLYGDFSSGQVLLGKPNATGYVFIGTRTLNVLGGVLADSVRIALSGTWADDVFDKDYQLKSLNELEKYITTNKHLPDIPTGSEVKSNGINVAEMEANLLKKIEELTLYVIELKKESELQQKEIKKLKSRMKS